MSSALESSVIVDFVNFALGQNDRTGICAILGEIAKATNSAGATLWEMDPDIPLNDPAARLFIAGHWFQSGRRFAAYDLSVWGSLAGTVMVSGQTNTMNDVAADPRFSKSRTAAKFYERHNIAKLQAAPVRFVDGSAGVLEVFRTANEPDFTTENQTLLERFCSLLPGVHDSLHHKVSFRLIDRVKDLLQSAEYGLADPMPVVQSLCENIRQCFRLIEASVFLEDPNGWPGEFRLVATTCQEYIVRDVYRAGETGKTSWAITFRKPIRIWDLRSRNKTNEKLLIERLHPGLIWDDPINIESVTCEILKSSEETLPPFSFIAEPIFSGGDIRGVLRCCTMKDAPYYFTHRERSLLAVIASQVGQFWSKWRDRSTIRQENVAWSRLVDSIRALNYSANSELRRQSPDVLNVFRKGLDATANVIPGGEIIDIRLVDQEKDELYFAVTSGDAWTEEAKKKRFPVGKKPPDSAGAIVYQTRQMIVIPNIQQSPDKAVFSSANSMIIAPIRSRNRVYGVIDIRNTGSQEFPPYAQQIAELLGQQFGLYHELIDTVHDLRTVEKKLIEQIQTTEQAFADWQHQVRGPINQAYLHLLEAVRAEFHGYDQVPGYLKVQRGLLHKAKQRSQGLRLFLDMARGHAPRLNFRRIECSELVKLLVEACADNRVLASQRRMVDFEVRATSFQILERRKLLADPDLLEQAVNNIIDNAFKYSYRQTQIVVTGEDSGLFFKLAISNRGINLLERDLEHIGKRGWRGEKAITVTGEGSGIGLWLVDYIMKAHRGRLEVLPTSQTRTEVQLLFPWQ
jgi:signal transduction histidine kinase